MLVSSEAEHHDDADDGESQHQVTASLVVNRVLPDEGEGGIACCGNTQQELDLFQRL
jgi:hypothetical protein